MGGVWVGLAQGHGGGDQSLCTLKTCVSSLSLKLRLEGLFWGAVLAYVSQ